MPTSSPVVSLIQRRSCEQVERTELKAIAHVPPIRAWLSYNAKFNASKTLLAHENDSYTDASHDASHQEQRD
jgi:hypothetical protein